MSSRLTPNGSRDEIDGIALLADGCSVLKVRVRAHPEDRKANEALLRLLAKTVRIPAQAIRLECGTGGRMKSKCFQGDLENLVARLERLCSPF